MKKSAYLLQELAELTDSTIVGNPSHSVTGYADLESAQESDVSFLSKPRYGNTRYVTAMKQSRAGAVFIAPSIEKENGKNYLVVEDPSMAFQKTIELMRGGPTKHSYFSDIHTHTHIHETVKIGKNAIICPNVVIEAFVTIGDNAFIGAGVYIGPHTEIGNDCLIQPNVIIREYCHLGNNVIIQSGSVIGSWGFGYSTNEKGIHTRISQIGTVFIEDDVEIGSNTVIDRARFTETRIGRGTKIDSGVIIGHNVKIGQHTLICGQSAIAGSTRIGQHVVIAGQCGIDGHLTIEDGVIITAKSGVTKSLKRGKYGGFPARPLQEFNKNNVHALNLVDQASQIKELQARCEKLEKALSTSKVSMEK